MPHSQFLSRVQGYILINIVVGVRISQVQTPSWSRHNKSSFNNASFPVAWNALIGQEVHSNYNQQQRHASSPTVV